MKKMNNYNWFMVACALLQAFGGLQQLYRRDWKMGTIFLLYGICTGLLSKVK